MELVPRTALARQATTAGALNEVQLERYKYILQQLHTLNENVYRFLALYQTLATVLIGAGLTLFVGYKQWGLDPGTARSGVVALLWLVTLIAAFTTLLIVMGILNWLDYRHEECELADETVYPGFRKPPRLGNLFRWYETYIVLFIVSSMVFMWVYATNLILPAMR